MLNLTVSRQAEARAGPFLLIDEAAHSQQGEFASRFLLDIWLARLLSRLLPIGIVHRENLHTYYEREAVQLTIVSFVLLLPIQYGTVQHSIESRLASYPKCASLHLSYPARCPTVTGRLYLDRRDNMSRAKGRRPALLSRGGIVGV